MEDWVEIGQFPNYSVSTHGRVRNDSTRSLMVQRMNQRGIVYVGLTKNHKQHRRSVSVLVATSFITPNHEHFDTPIHLDGDKTNLHVSNLLWRPRWFALKYCHQFNVEREGFDSPIEDISTGEVFETSWDAAIKYGLLDYEIKMAILNNSYVWPTFQRFRKV